MAEIGFSQSALAKFTRPGWWPERIDQLGERIDKLVSGIGEFIRQRQN
jgi:hypothetical protein